jgi:hypothetical protein
MRKALTVAPDVVVAALTARHFACPARVDTTTRVPRTYATDGVPFAFSASSPSAAFRATISAPAAPAARSATQQATAEIRTRRPMPRSYAACALKEFKIP